MWIVCRQLTQTRARRDPEQSIGTIEMEALAGGLLLENGELMTESENLSFQVGSGSEAGANRVEEGNQDRPHTCPTVSADAAPLNCSQGVRNFW